MYNPIEIPSNLIKTGLISPVWEPHSLITADKLNSMIAIPVVRQIWKIGKTSTTMTISFKDEELEYLRNKPSILVVNMDGEDVSSQLCYITTDNENEENIVISTLPMFIGGSQPKCTCSYMTGTYDQSLDSYVFNTPLLYVIETTALTTPTF